MGQFYLLWYNGIKDFINVLNDLVLNPPSEKDIFLYLNYTERDHERRISIADRFADRPIDRKKALHFQSFGVKFLDLNLFFLLLA